MPLTISGPSARPILSTQNLDERVRWQCGGARQVTWQWQITFRASSERVTAHFLHISHNFKVAVLSVLHPSSGMRHYRGCGLPCSLMGAQWPRKERFGVFRPADRSVLNLWSISFSVVCIGITVYILGPEPHGPTFRLSCL